MPRKRKPTATRKARPKVTRRKKLTKHQRTVIKCVRDLFKDRKHWTKGDYARDRNSRSVTIDSPDAVRFCLVGGIKKCSKSGTESASVQALLSSMLKDRDLADRIQLPRGKELKHYQLGSLTTLNDTYGLKAVQSFLDIALEK